MAASSPAAPPSSTPHCIVTTAAEALDLSDTASHMSSDRDSQRSAFAEQGAAKYGVVAVSPSLAHSCTPPPPPSAATEFLDIHAAEAQASRDRDSQHLASTQHGRVGEGVVVLSSPSASEKMVLSYMARGANDVLVNSAKNAAASGDGDRPQSAFAGHHMVGNGSVGASSPAASPSSGPHILTTPAADPGNPSIIELEPSGDGHSQRGLAGDASRTSIKPTLSAVCSETPAAGTPPPTWGRGTKQPGDLGGYSYQDPYMFVYKHDGGYVGTSQFLFEKPSFAGKGLKQVIGAQPSFLPLRHTCPSEPVELSCTGARLSVKNHPTAYFAQDGKGHHCSLAWPHYHDALLNAVGLLHSNQVADRGEWLGDSEATALLLALVTGIEHYVSYAPMPFLIRMNGGTPVFFT